MALSNFFRVNMPYCIDITGNTIVARNREYQPLNTVALEYDMPPAARDTFLRFVLTLPKGAVMPLDAGGGNRVFLYDDRTNPSDPGNDCYWAGYQRALQMLADLPVKQ